MKKGNINKVYIAIKLDDGTTRTLWLDNPNVFPHIFLKIKAQQPENVLELEGFLSELIIPTEQ